MDGVKLAVQAAAAYRITRLIQEDQLPPFPWLRTLMNQAVVKRSQKAEASVGDFVAAELTYMVNCPWCLGFWVSVAVLLADAVVPRLWRPMAAALALSAAVGHARTKLD